MTVVAHWFSPDVLRTLGLSLLHFLWQGAALAALATALIAAARQASTRYAIAVGALVLMVAAPVVTYFVLHQDEPAFSASKQAAVPTIAYAVNLATHRVVASTQSRFLSGGLLTIFVELWFVGVMLFSLRTAGGFFVIARLRRRESKPMNPGLLALCREMQHRLGISRAIRYCETLHLDAPAVVGWFRPVVLLPISALSGLTGLQLRAVVAHELAHIRRLDAFFNLFQVVAETLLFYHPAVWWLSKRIRAERENCCDDVALSVCGNPAEYARALALMEQWRAAPTFALAANGGPLASRVTRLLGLTEKGSSLRNAGVAFGVLCLAAALIAGNALFGVVRTASAHSLSLHQSDDRAGVIVVTAPRPSPQAKPSPKPTPSSTQETAPASKSKSYIEGMKAEGFDNLSADDLIAMKIQGITPEYIHEIRAEGFKPSPDELVAMKVQGITPEYIHEVRAMKLNVDVDSLIGMKVQGIDANYVRTIRATGLNPDKDEWVALKVQGVSGDFIKGLQAAGFKPDVDEVVAAKVMGITPQFIELARSHGFKNLDLNKLIQLKHANVLE